jgi:hypothetical protein
MSSNETLYNESRRRFMKETGMDSSPSTGPITSTNNAYLYPYYDKFKELTSDYKTGVFILDARGIYTPIELGNCGVVHVERIPIVKPAVYGLADLSNCAVLIDGKKTIIFQGVILLENYGWKFINENFQVIPIAGFAPKTTKRLILTDGSTKRASRETVQEQEDEFSDYFED